MGFSLVSVQPEELPKYKADMQAAFQKGFEDVFGKTDSVILPEADIDKSLNAEGSAAYKAVVDGETVGGAVVVFNESTQHNHLDLLFVKNGAQGRGIGKRIWFELERLYPDTKLWETFTPYFDRRNIHFYVNVCGFHITEFFNEKHPMPDTPEDFIGDGNEGMFEFEKQMHPACRGGKQTRNPFRNAKTHFYTLLSGVSCVLRSFIFLFPCLHVWRIRLYEGLRLRKAFFHRIRPTQICVRTCPQRIEAFFRIRRIGP